MKGLRAAWLGVFLLGACATTPPARQDCTTWYHELDARIERAGVRDAQARRVDGFPYLRVDRPLAALRGEASADTSKLSALLERMRALDVEGREAELANLGVADGERRAALDTARNCGRELGTAALADPAARARLLEQAVVPDDYSTAMRVLGLYALTRYPFYAGVQDYQEDVRRSFRAARTLAAVRYTPPESPAMPRAAQADAIARASGNPLGIPEPSAEALERLFAAHAPVFEIEQTGDFDRPGALRWHTGGAMPEIDPTTPAVYRQAAWTRYRGRMLLQLVYTIWFSERPPDSALDILAGRLDGVTWRVTLAPDGEPLVYDTMHPCGCYHMFFPTPRAQPVASPEPTLEWAFSPAALPRVADGERPVLRIATRTHYVEGVSLERAGAGGTRYALRPYGGLRSLPRPEGGRASAFGPDGLIAGSQRLERFLFWPMGIDSAGAMRQWGRHATAFVGRRHFDDADLLEKRFVLELR